VTIEEIKKEISELGPIHPGVLTKQMIRCSKSNCHCANGGDKHGPYWQLSWTINKKSGTKHIKPDDVPGFEERIQNYKRLKELIIELAQVSIAIAHAKESK
jgi:hypothetical protein